MNAKELKLDMAKARMLGSLAFAEGKTRLWFNSCHIINEIIGKYKFPSKEQNKILAECLGGWDRANVAFLTN